MTYSLGEIEGLARKAARGAGMSWGLAEEAGHATSWLYAHGLAGAEALASVLHARSEWDDDAASPVPHGAIWQARQGALCPIATGAALSDRAADIARGGPLRLIACHTPLLLLSFLSSIAQRTGTAIGLDADGISAICSTDALYLGYIPRDSARTATLDVALTPDCALNGKPVTILNRACPSQEALSTLNLFAQRVYAPETEARRLTGAGEEA